MTYYRSFRVVADEYHYTKPVNEREYERNDPQKKIYGTSRDIRPLDLRIRKWERIAKLSNTCYALMCGLTLGDTAYPSWRYRSVKNASPDVVASYAPIAWHRIGDDDVVSVSNAAYKGATGHHKFLSIWLPRGITFVNKNGKQFLRVQQPDTVATYSLRLADANADRVKPNSFNLQFKAEGDGVFTPYKLPDVATKTLRKRVDTQLKRRFKQRLEEFNQWVMTMGPLFPMDWKSMDAAKEAAQAYLQTVPGQSGIRIWRVEEIPAEIAREALIYPQHPLRMYLGMSAWSAIGVNDSWKREGRELARLLAFNNKVFGFEREVDVDM